MMYNKVAFKKPQILHTKGWKKCVTIISWIFAIFSISA